MQNPETIFLKAEYILTDQEELGQNVAQKIQMEECFGQVTYALESRLFSK